jgi:hypothetical protein
MSFPTISKKQFILQDLEFGKVGGEEEARYVNNFEKFFYDGERQSERIIDPEIYFLIGRKGTGKTLLAEYVKKIHKNNSNKFIEIASLRDFNFNELSDFSDSSNNARKFLSIWQWYLLITMSKLICQDKSITDKNTKSKLQDFLKNLLGLELSQNNVLERTRKLKLETNANLFGLLGIKPSIEDSTQSVKGSYLDYLNALKKSVCAAAKSTQSQFLIFFDNLDDSFGEELYRDSVQSLIHATVDLNRFFWDQQCRAKFVLIIRSDILLRLNFSDLHKYEIDNSLKLDWYPEKNESSPLFLTVLHKIKTSLNVCDEEEVIFRKLFPERIDGKPTTLWIKNQSLTRPRDLINMLNLIKKHYPRIHNFPEHAFKTIKLEYSRILLREIENEMHGHAEQNKIENALSLIRNLGKKSSFDFNFLREKKPNYFQQGVESEEKVKDLIRFLFQFSVICNIFHNEENPSCPDYYSCAHREDIIEPDFNARFIFIKVYAQRLKGSNREL